MTVGTHPAPAIEPRDFASPEARQALAVRLGPFGIRLDAGELGLLVDRLGRVPRWAELVIMNTMWSEHCSYKSTRHLLKRLPTEAPQVVLGPGEDAGAVRLGTHEGKDILCVLAHESHNHPSQIVPYEGAATGVGGIVRDVYCMGAETVGTLDALRMGTGRTSGGLKAREILSGVVTGIADYGNALGVPNVGGDLEFHEGYDSNVLVNVVALGLVEADRLIHSRVPGPGDYAFVLVGKPTDSSGFGGASFSSGVLAGEDDQRGAVQLPDPFLKRVLAVANKALLDLAHERGWAIGFKDLGAGGIACVTSELADHGGVGADIDLDAAHRVPEPLAPEVLLCAETQERFCFVVPWEARHEACAVFNDRFRLGDVYPHAGASVVGRTRADGTYRVTWQGEAIVECPVSFITSGVKCERPATAAAVAGISDGGSFPAFDLAREIEAAVRSLALCSRGPLFHRYDPEVQGRTTIARGAADAGVLLAAPGAPFGLAASVDGNPRLGALDPGLGARNAVWESARNVAAVGAWPWALTDCLNYGRPTDPAVMGQLEAGIDGLAEAARAAGTLPLRAPGEALEAWLALCRSPLPALPFVSGNVSLYNEDDQGRAVPPSPIVACVGLVPDVSRTATPGLKAAGDALVFVGTIERGRLGGSLFAERRDRADDRTLAPAPEWGEEGRAHLALALGLVHDGIALACHDVSGGGLAQALCEMAFGSGAGLGFHVAARADDREWFSEEPGFVLEIPQSELARVLALGAVELGRVSGDGSLRFGDVALDRAPLEKAWGEALEPAFETREEALV